MISSNLYQYNCCFYGVPKTFEFAKVRLQDDMRFCYIDQTYPKTVPMLWNLFEISVLFHEAKNTYKIQLKCVFSYLEKSIRVLDSDTKNPTLNKMNEIYDQFVFTVKICVWILFHKTERESNEMDLLPHIIRGRGVAPI